MNTEGGIGEKTKWGTSWGGCAQTVSRADSATEKRGKADPSACVTLVALRCAPANRAARKTSILPWNYCLCRTKIENRHGRIAATCSISNCGQIDSDFRQIAVGSSVLAAKTNGFEQISDVPPLFATRAGSGDALPDGLSNRLYEMRRRFQ
ncbi:hypothetical protein [Caballeronia pedi]|uniref:hypothetical protein n=1 Tax=Caballeronia pedi TaxID=1777141 RepID=UPI0011774703|nr:hypothetical protein [Caballeronia pedi]